MHNIHLVQTVRTAQLLYLFLQDLLSPPTVAQQSAGKFSMLEFSMMYFRQNIDRYATSITEKHLKEWKLEL